METRNLVSHPKAMVSKLHIMAPLSLEKISSRLVLNFVCAYKQELYQLFIFSNQHAVSFIN